MLKIRKILLLQIIIALVTCEIYINTTSIQIPQSVNDVQYSPDQKYLAIVSSKSIQLYEGVSGKLLRTITIQNKNLSTLTFSQDSQMFAFQITDINTNESQYYIMNKTTTSLQSSIQKPKIIYNIKQKNKINFELQPLSRGCFNADNTIFIYGMTTRFVAMYFFRKNLIVINQFQNNLPITGVACSPYRSLQFIMAGSSQTKQQQAKMKLYQIDPFAQMKIISLKHQFTVQKDQYINDIIYSPEGEYLYRCGSRGVIKTNLYTYQEVSIQLPDDIKDIKYVKINKRQDIFVVSTKNNQIFIRKSQPTNSLTQQIQQTYLVYSSIFSLSPTGTSLFYISASNQGSTGNRCILTQYLSQSNDTCYQCSSNCQTCLNTAQTCHSCKQFHYITQNNLCLNCSQNCKKCTNSSHCFQCSEGKYIKNNKCADCSQYCKTCDNILQCTSCYNNFIIVNGSCKCQSGKYPKDNNCFLCFDHCEECSDQINCLRCSEGYKLKNGQCIIVTNFPVWAIIFIIVSVLIITIGIIVFIRYLRKKKFKESLLISEIQTEQQQTFK